MEIADAKDLIHDAVIPLEEPLAWADLGCGNGTFTKALAQLLPDGSTLYAVDKNQQHIIHPDEKKVHIEFIQADFDKEELMLPPLDGILMANALHYVKGKVSLLARLQKLLNAEGKFIIVEYDTMRANPWVPYPIDFLHLQDLLYDAGFRQVKKLGERTSIYNRSNMYSCLARKGN
ncbi:class I SAM-dependent methyltransferase [Catalinimonas niigatensis]|uniref:class I SAM-dependent methyltransferase n=1 Tax=Catalinimonas niigatensis TaxID=1397264 RepID=UPI0026669CF0|nr:class I SAM-dependent methyltransferase [Catalinimonas niigatensis]WPP52441.1 class I SAM-dependent methyltransferase [Catalinimonas niigatensis]